MLIPSVVRTSVHIDMEAEDSWQEPKSSLGIICFFDYIKTQEDIKNISFMKVSKGV